MTPDAGERIVREQFRSPNPSAPPRIGVEVEFICVDRASGRPAPPLARDGSTEGILATVPAVQELASSRGWRCEDGRGLPAFTRPDGTVISWEPGGQIEIATPPFGSLDALDQALSAAVADLVESLGRREVVLLARGLDPRTPLELADLWLDHPRYRRMSAHYDRGGADGRRMMRQTAAVHVNLDFGESPVERWTRANLAVPSATAVFANSRWVEGRRGWRSERARTWRTLDPSRTGAFGPAADPAHRYLEFARSARAFLVGPGSSPALPWSECEGEADATDWRAHLSTLFPEVRPRTYLEIRSIDALPPGLVTVAAAYLAGIVYGSAELPEVEAPTRERLRLAAREGMASAAMRDEALAWWGVAFDGLDALGPGFVSPSLIRRARSFRTAFTERGRDPGDTDREWVLGAYDQVG
jgi:glutamate--cysteine ligase